ncbi:hypothetical protein [Micromonospora zhanjiangensis]|uniref:Uncharacterized protein n=1 Tax=Micromonospora zhanjiangensis TaxID=1522057 RepID=A0ABV8KP07_9ACTN
MDEDEIADIAGGDEKRIRALRGALGQLARSPNPLLREMAAAVQNGELSLRQAVASESYGSELAAPFRTFWTSYQQMTPEQREDLVERANDGL